MPDDDLPLLRSGAGRLGLALSTAQFDALRRYAELLLEANQRVNLTGAKDLAELEVRHLLDSLSVAPYLPPPWREEEEAPIPLATDRPPTQTCPARTFPATVCPGETSMRVSPAMRPSVSVPAIGSRPDVSLMISVPWPGVETSRR